MSASVERRADTAARHAAQTRFDAPLVIEAGAGTGKTTVLVARVLAWCLGVGWERTAARLAAADAPPAPERIAETLLERVVAITFTEAAAAEMESRALDALSDIARGAPVLGFDPAAVGADPALLRLRAGELLAGFDHLRFQTIHAFCRRLLAAHPIEAGLHPRFTVDARGTARAAAVRETLEERLREIREDGDADVEALLLEGMGAPELEGVLVELAAAAVPARAFAVDPFAPERIRAWVGELHAAAAAFVAAEAGRFAARKGTTTAVRVAAAAARTRDATSAGIETVEDLARLTAALCEPWTKTEVERLGKFANAELIDSERAAFDPAEIAAFAAAAERLHPHVVSLERLDPRMLGLLHRVLAPLLAGVEAHLAEVGAESFDALLRRTRDLLAGDPAIAAAVRGEIDQLLVDEFQDTDRVQCEIVSVLALEGDPAERPGFFLVGDPKQSVYGWRSADVGAYMRFVERASAQPGAERHALCVNHRSVPAVLAEVERVVEPVMIEEAGVQPPFQRLVPSDAHAAVEGSGRACVAAVEYWWSERWDAASGAFTRSGAAETVELEAAQLAADLRRQAERGVRWKDIAVLLRSTGDLDRYLSALRDAAIPYLVDRDRSYYQRREVRDAAALVCAALDANDQVALVATLRSAWVGVPDAAWRPLWERDFPLAARGALAGHADAQERLRAIAGEVAREIAEQPGLAELAGWEVSLLRAVEVLAALRRCFASEPADAFVEALRTTTLVEATEAARYPGGFRLANLARFFRELQELLEEHAGDVAQVLRALRADATAPTEFYEGRPKDPDEDAVRVLTIHGAKGLDFEHVYVMQLHKGSRAPDAAFRHDLRDGCVEWRLTVRDLRVETLGWSAVAARRARVERAESVRTLYVALTRARSRVVLAGRFDAERTDGTHAGWVWRARGAALAAARERLLEARQRGVATSEDRVDGAVVRWLGLLPPSEAASSARAATAPIPIARVRADAARFATLDAEAHARAARPYLGRASEHVADAWREHAAVRRAGEGDTGADRPGDSAVAAAVGTALHALIERFDWSAPDRALEWMSRSEEMRAALERLPAPERDPALARAAALLDGLAASELWHRLGALAPFTLARELPVLLPGEDDAASALGGLVGAIDWLYWDAAAAEVVVVDFKTDRIDSGAKVAERVDRHCAQAERYRRAAQAALGLAQAPRVELWFLAAAARAVVEPRS